MYSTYEEECEAAPEKKKKIIVLGGGPNLRHGHGVGHERDAGDFRVAGGEGGAVGCGDEIVETGDPVFRGVEQPRREIDAHKGVERKGLAQRRGELDAAHRRAVVDPSRRAEASAAGADLCVFPESFLHGYTRAIDPAKARARFAIASAFGPHSGSPFSSSA